MRIEFGDSLVHSKSAVTLRDAKKLEFVYWSALSNMVKTKDATPYEFYQNLKALVHELSDYKIPMRAGFPMGRDLERLYIRHEQELDQFLGMIMDEFGVEAVQTLTKPLKNYGTVVEYITPYMKTQTTAETRAKLFRLGFLFFVATLMSTASMLEKYTKEDEDY